MEKAFSDLNLRSQPSWKNREQQPPDPLSCHWRMRGPHAGLDATLQVRYAHIKTNGQPSWELATSQPEERRSDNSHCSFNPRRRCSHLLLIKCWRQDRSCRKPACKCQLNNLNREKMSKESMSLTNHSAMVFLQFLLLRLSGPARAFLSALGQKLIQMHRQLHTGWCTVGRVGMGLCHRPPNLPGNQGNNSCYSPPKPIPQLSERRDWRSGMADELLSAASSIC